MGTIIIFDGESESDTVTDEIVEDWLTPPDSKKIREGMTPQEIADIVSDSLMDVIRENLEKIVPRQS